MKLLGKTAAFVCGVAAGVMVGMTYEEEMDDFHQYYGKTKRNMKHSLKNMRRFFD